MLTSRGGKILFHRSAHDCGMTYRLKEISRGVCEAPLSMMKCLKRICIIISHFSSSLFTSSEFFFAVVKLTFYDILTHVINHLYVIKCHLPLWLIQYIRCESHSHLKYFVISGVQMRCNHFLVFHFFSGNIEWLMRCRSHKITYSIIK